MDEGAILPEKAADVRPPWRNARGGAGRGRGRGTGSRGRRGGPEWRLVMPEGAP